MGWMLEFARYDENGILKQCVCVLICMYYGAIMFGFDSQHMQVRL